MDRREISQKLGLFDHKKNDTAGKIGIVQNNRFGVQDGAGFAAVLRKRHRRILLDKSFIEKRFPFVVARVFIFA